MVFRRVRVCCACVLCVLVLCLVVCCVECVLHHHRVPSDMGVCFLCLLCVSIQAQTCVKVLGPQSRASGHAQGPAAPLAFVKGKFSLHYTTLHYTTLKFSLYRLA